MQTKEITINGKKFAAQEVTLENYPEIVDAFQDLRSDDTRKRRDAIYVLLQRCADVPDEDKKKCTLREMNAAIDAISEVNGISAPKAGEQSPAQETPTA